MFVSRVILTACHPRARSARFRGLLGLCQLGPSSLSHRVGQGALPPVRRVDVDQRGARTVVAYPCHEFLRIRGRIGGELVAGMAQVVNVDAFKADRDERRIQTRRRKLVLDNAAPSGLVNARTPAGTAPRWLRRSGTIRSAKSTTRRPARDFGGPNTGTAPALLSWRATRTVRASRAAPAALLARRQRRSSLESARRTPGRGRWHA